MVKKGYLEMKAGEASYDDLIGSDLKELGMAVKNLASHAYMLSTSEGVGTTLLQYLAAFAAIYLLILDRTHWRTNMLTALLVPYIFLTLPDMLFSLLRGEFGKWVAFIAVVLQLFFPRHMPDWFLMPGSVILLLVVAPSFLAYNVRDGLAGVIVCLGIGCYLLQEHIRAAGGFRNALTQRKGICNTVGIVLLFVFPVWCLVLYLH